MQNTENGTIPEGTEFFTEEYGLVKFYKEEQVFNLKVLSYFNKYENQWTIGGHMPWDKIRPISEYKPA